MTQFHKGSKKSGNLVHNPLFRLLAECILSQQAAGFKTKRGEAFVDLREWKCPTCNGSGFNTGWGHIDFVCGYEITGDEESGQCTAKKKHKGTAK